MNPPPGPRPRPAAEGSEDKETEPMIRMHEISKGRELARRGIHP